jgi:outer membrane protein assembly factor BamA
LLCGIYFIFIALISDSFLYAQDSSQTEFPDSTYYVNSILISGNATTKDYVILREMTLKPGALLTTELIAYDKNRIYSLGLFNEVQIHPVPSTEQTVDILVVVSERWYIYPYPIVGLKDRDWNKFYFGAGLSHLNFRGRNEKVFFSFVLGYDPGFSIVYRNPSLTDDGEFFLSTRIAYSNASNRSLQAQAIAGKFTERHTSFSATVGTRFSISRTVWFNVGYEIVNMTDVTPTLSLSPTGIDRFPFMGIGASYDTRDLMEYPSYGTFAQTTVTKFGMPSADVDFVRYSADVRKYIPMNSRVVLTTRVFTDVVAAGPTPVYNRTYFGYGERVRGHFNQIIEGENILGVSSELHYTMIEPTYFTVKFLPPEFGVWKFGMYAALFGDAGTVWFRRTPLTINNFLKGYGIGLHFLLPYSAVLRAEYGLDEYGKGEFIFDLGTTF